MIIKMINENGANEEREKNAVVCCLEIVFFFLFIAKNFCHFSIDLVCFSARLFA